MRSWESIYQLFLHLFIILFVTMVLLGFRVLFENKDIVQGYIPAESKITIIERYEKPEEFVFIEITDTWYIMNRLLRENAVSTKEFDSNWRYRIRMSDNANIDTENTYYIYVFPEGYCINGMYYKLVDVGYMYTLIETIDLQYQRFEKGFVNSHSEEFIPHGSTRDPLVLTT